MRSHSFVVSSILMLSGIVVTASAATADYKRDVPTALAAEAKISESVAGATALSRVKGGRIVALELEREGGKLLYSIDVRVPGKSGIEEVHVSATDGAVLLVNHESAKAERAEAVADKKAAAKQKTP